MTDIGKKASEANQASLELANVSLETRNEALRNIENSIRNNKGEILEANKKDVEEAKKMLEKGEYTQAFVDRLKVDSKKVKKIADMIQSVSKQEDPLNKTIKARELDEGLNLYKTSVPIGVIGSIFESRPDVLPQISSLCLKSGNSVFLKGGSEAENSNRILYELIKESAEKAGIPSGWIQLIEARKEVRELLDQDDEVDLLVPRGSKEFISFIQENSKIPVLGHARGLCHTYVDKEAGLENAVQISFDGKVQYPAVCNATETLLVQNEIASDFLPKIVEKYKEAGVKIKGCERTLNLLKDDDIEKAEKSDWDSEYLDLEISIKIVDSLEKAVNHVNTHGSKHTESIVSENESRLLKFMEGVDSSSVMANASTRFSDGYRYGLGAEVGISTGKIHARGPVGMEGLTTYKYYLVGDGHKVESYSGENSKSFSHKEIQDLWSEKRENWSKD